MEINDSSLVINHTRTSPTVVDPHCKHSHVAKRMEHNIAGVSGAMCDIERAP